MIQGSAANIASSEAAAWRLPTEIAFLLGHGVATETLLEAGRIAAQCGVSADRALLRSGLVEEQVFYRALAQELGLGFCAGRLDVHSMARFPEAILTGVIPLSHPGPIPSQFAYAPRGEEISRLLASRECVQAGLLITTPAAIRRSLLLARAGPIAAQAADGLARSSPDLSFRAGFTRGQVLAALLLVAAGAVCWIEASAEYWLMATILLGVAFLGNTALRLAAVLESAPTSPHRSPPRILDCDLPNYTVLVALHREGRVLPKLVRAISALDYPAPKLQVLFILEQDDLETASALQDLSLPAYIEVIVAPPGLPRAKPRALNVALPLARGEFVTVYDAEDVPDPNQLRLAVSTFRRAEPDVACIQARLVIDNASDSLLTRFFALEYAALFDVTNPALARFDMPVPLGGTSNHFRKDVLVALGGWDAWNVTEDADLGVRLAAAGYRVADLASSTLEEAPRHLAAWLRQRTRWMKGFLQVSITHSRRPIRNLRRLGLLRLLGATAVTFGTVASAFGFPFFVALAVDAVASGSILAASSALEIAGAAIGVTLFGAGALALWLPPVEALRRRRWWSLLPLVPLMPVYYLLVSLAAWRGLVELVVAPQRWNKTDHGLALTSRIANRGSLDG